MHHGRTCRAFPALYVIVLSLLLPTWATGGDLTPHWATTGPEGGPADCIAADDASLVYLGGANGVYKSIDAGSHWRHLAASPAPVVKMALNAGNTNEVYAATNENLYKSSDGGTTWNVILPFLNRPDGWRNVTTLSVDGLNVYITFDATTSVPNGDCLVYSTNGGLAWTSVTPSIVPTGDVTSIRDFTLDPNTPGTMLLSNGSLVYLTTGDITHWTSYRDDVYPLVAVYAPRGYRNIYYAIDYFGSIWKSDNNSSAGSMQGVWVLISYYWVGHVNAIVGDSRIGAVLFGADPLYAEGSDGGVWRYSSGWGGLNTGLGNGFDNRSVQALAFAAPSGAYAALAGGFYRTPNALGTGAWEPRNLGLTNAQVTCLTVANDSRHTLYAGTRGAGIFKSTDGGATWTALNGGLLVSGLALLYEVHAIVVEPNNPRNICAATNAGIYFSLDAGATWNRRNAPFVDSGTPKALVADPQHPGTLYAHSDWGFFKSTDSGQTWSQFPFYCETFPHALVFDPVSLALYAPAEDGLYKWAPGDSDWAKVTGFGSKFCTSMGIDPRNPRVMYVGTYLYSGKGGGFFKSTDSGATWTEMAPSLLSLRSVNSVAVNARTSAVTVGLASGGAWQSSDGGSTWHLASGGVFTSTDGGDTWTDLGLAANRSVNAVAVDGATRSLYAAVNAGGVAVNRAGPFNPVIGLSAVELLLLGR